MATKWSFLKDYRIPQSILDTTQNCPGDYIYLEFMSLYSLLGVEESLLDK